MKLTLKDQKIFKRFCSIETDREDIITKILEKESIPYSRIVIDNASHIFLYPEVFKKKGDINVLIAHYDRVEGTPGANDNSAAVFYLLNHAKKLKDKDHMSIIIFTDREEVGNADSVTSQGSYALGKYFRTKKLENLRFFVFDMCGIGTTLLLGTAGETLIKKHFGDKYHESQLKDSIERVKSDSENIMLSVNGGEFFYLTPLFSDDLGLILNEYPAVLISLLPYREAVEYKEDPSVLPKSWRCNHTMNDTIETLDPKSWDILSPLLSSISNISTDKEESTSCKLSFKCYTQVLITSGHNKYSKEASVSYITKPLFQINNMKTSNKERLQTFQLLSSDLTCNSFNYLKSLVPKLTDDFSFNLYKYIKSVVELEYMNLPVIIKDILYKKAGGSSIGNILNFLYGNTLKNFEKINMIQSRPVNKKVKISLEFNNGTGKQRKLKVIWNKSCVGDICLKFIDGSVIIDEGYFEPDIFLKLDPLNMLKGIRLTLIKWLKLNNNNSLLINLNVSNWIGCYQLYRLLSMELEGRKTVSANPNLKYLWKR